MERDSWIEVLVKHVDAEPPSSGSRRQRSNSRMSSKDVVVTATQPLSGIDTANGKFTGAPSPSLINSMESKRATPSSSWNSLPPVMQQELGNSQAEEPLKSDDPTPATPGASFSRPLTLITSPSLDYVSNSPPPNAPTPRLIKRQSTAPVRPSYTPAYLSKVASEGMSMPPGYNPDKERDRKAKSGRFWHNFGKTPEKIFRPVFGVPIPDSIAVASVANLPAIVFRCIEYLEAKKAEEEEGIYRLSGSSAVIKGLKDRFDAEGDVKLLVVDEFWDLHAIAGLLKTFLRELPTSLLTRDLHPRFLADMGEILHPYRRRAKLTRTDLVESSARVAELSRLVSDLPPPSYALLRALTAHLILIVRNAASNKMNLRNIGIVFSPTLGIPAGIFSDLVSHFGAIFDDVEEEHGIASEAQSALNVPNHDLEETIGRKRNSMLYQAGGADAMLGLGGRSLDSGGSSEAVTS